MPVAVSTELQGKSNNKDYLVLGLCGGVETHSFKMTADLPSAISTMIMRLLVFRVNVE